MTLLKRKRPGLNDPMSVVTRFVNACNRHDADGVFSCLHPSFDSIQPMFPTRNFRGADQVRRNWQAIFDAEPGFRLTVLRSAVQDDIVWLELHGAGRDAEVAGVFVMGVQGDRIRWARIYSGLVEEVAGAGDGSGAVEAVPTHDGLDGARADGEIAPVVDIDRSVRRRRRSRGRQGDAEPAEEAPVAVEVEPQAEAEAEVAAVVEPQGETAVVEPEVVAPPENAVAVEPSDAVADQAAAGPEVLVAPGMAPAVPVVEEVTAAHDMVVELDAEAGAGSVPAVDDEAVTQIVEPVDEPPAAEPVEEDEPPKWRFGKKSR